MLPAEQYALIVEQAPIMIWRSDASGGCDYFNERWLAFRGRAMEDEIGNGWAEGVHPDDLDRCLKVYLTAFARREVFEMECRLRRFDGAYRWVFDRGVPYFDPAGNFAGFIGSCIDVTSRVEADQALREGHEKEIRKLQRLIRICSVCKRILNRAEEWGELETYIAMHSGAEFSHGLCSSCAAELRASLPKSTPTKP